MPPEKLQEILKLCLIWRQKMTVPSVNFNLPQAACFKGQTKLTLDDRRDINWFIRFFNDTTYFYHIPIDVSMELDASLQGLGARWGLQVYILTIPVGYLGFNIVHLEMVNLLAAIRVSVNQWAHKKGPVPLPVITR